MSALGWWWVRSWGLVAYLALWATALFGVTTSSRETSGWLHTPTVAALHRAWSVAVVVATALHVLVVAIDPASRVPWLATILPVGPGPVALGVVAAWWLAALVASQARVVPRPVWRAIHASAFGAYVVALVHALSAGTDRASPVFRAVVLGTAAVLLGAVLHRVAWAVAGPRAAAPRAPTPRG